VSRQSGLPGGLFVQAVDPTGPAAAAGLQPGDLITKADGQETTDAQSLLTHTLGRAPGDQVRITYVRDGTTRPTTVTLARTPGPGS
jgi:S1-C subfamily serine protease